MYSLTKSGGLLQSFPNFQQSFHHAKPVGHWSANATKGFITLNIKDAQIVHRTLSIWLAYDFYPRNSFKLMGLNRIFTLVNEAVRGHGGSRLECVRS